MASKSGTNLKIAVAPIAEETTAAKKPANKKMPAPTAEDTGVIAQLKLACTPKNRLALVIGLLLGGLVPLLSYVLAHYEIEANVALYAQIPTYMVLGGLAYSAKSVYEWGTAAFHSSWKALGFLLLIEGTMVFSHIQWLGLVALGYLIAINAINTGVNLALAKK